MPPPSVDDEDAALDRPKPEYTTQKDPPAAYMDLIDAGIRAAAARNHLTLDPKFDGKVIREFEFMGKRTTRLGNKEIAEATRENYERIY